MRCEDNWRNEANTYSKYTIYKTHNIYSNRTKKKQRLSLHYESFLTDYGLLDLNLDKHQTD